MTQVIEVDVRHRLGAFSLNATFRSDGRLTALFGRSGSGKTTLVNVIGGLIRPDGGRVAVDGRPLVDSGAGLFVPKHRRRIGYVFQEARLFPHLSVRQNLLFGRWFAPRERAGAMALDIAVDLLGVGHLLDRRPAGLSGGEKQRVAIGRALLANPHLLLMDEPLASLDDARKAEILPYIERLRDEAGVPIVYVSHSVAEVARLATTLVVMDEGRVAAVGPTAEMMSRLDLPILTHGSETGSVLEAIAETHDAEFDLTVFSTRAGSIHAPGVSLPIGARTRVRILASDVLLSLKPLENVSALNAFAGVIEEIAPGEGAATEIRLDCSGDRLIARLTQKSVAALGLAPGKKVFATIKSVSILPLSNDGPGRAGHAVDGSA